MGKKDYKKGMSDAMEAYEAFSEKQEAATRHVAKQVNKVADKVDKLGGKIGEITTYITEQEKAALYRLNTPVDIADLDDAEKRILVAVLYQLSAEEDELTEAQQRYLLSVQQYLKIYNPQTSIDLEAVENIEDVSAQKAVLQAALEFFYLGTHPGTYTDDQMDFLDYFQINRKTRKEIMGYIKAIADTVGMEGLSEKYGFVANQPAAVFASYKDNGRIPEHVADLCISLFQYKPEEEYDDFDDAYGEAQICQFDSGQYFLETENYLVFCKARTYNVDDENELIADSAVGFFRVDKQSGAIERLDIDYEKDFGFFYDTRHLSHCVQGNTIYFAENRIENDRPFAPKKARIIVLDVEQKSCKTLQLPLSLTDKAVYSDYHYHYHLSANASYLLIHTLDRYSKSKQTRTFVVDLTKDMRMFTLEPKMAAFWDVFLWDNKFIIFGRESIGCSLYEYDVEHNTIRDLFQEYAPSEAFRDTFLSAFEGFDRRTFSQMEIIIEEMQYANDCYYFLISKLDSSHTGNDRCLKYVAFNPRDLKGTALLNSFDGIFSGDSFLRRNYVYAIDKGVLQAKEESFAEYKLQKFDYETRTITYNLAGSAREFVVLGDYLYRKASDNWEKTNISNGFDALQWEILLF